MDKTTTTNTSTEYCSCAVVRCAIGATECPCCKKSFKPAAPRSEVVRSPMVRR